MSASVSAKSPDLASQLSRNLATPGAEEKAALTVGNRVSSAEKAFLDVVSKPNATQGEIEKAKYMLQRAQKAFEALQQVFENMNQMIRRSIQGLSMR